jgi:hypothetical protein
MSDLAAALREAGHSEIANALERKELAGRLRHMTATSWRTSSKQAPRPGRRSPTPSPHRPRLMSSLPSN